MTHYREYNFDGLVGPTHNYAGLGSGNLASMASKDHVSNPRAAALEGLAKMRLLAEMGVPQAVLPPQRRPHVGYLRGKYGQASDEPPTAAEVQRLLTAAAENGDEGRRDLAVASSASAMWAANAATVSPSPDTFDKRCHFTVANLVSQPHRTLEAAERHRIFAHLFGDMMRFDVHPGLTEYTQDEGGANHSRICGDYGSWAWEIFNYGRNSGRGHNDYDPPTTFPPRQEFQASRTIAARHELWSEHTYFVRQNAAAIDAGVFHNDVISVANKDVLLIHERGWSGFNRMSSGPSVFAHFGDFAGRRREVKLESIFWEIHALIGVELKLVRFSDAELPLADAVRSYLFNSQLVTLPSGGMALVYPAECDAVPSAKAAIDRILREDNPVERAVRVDVRQSMNNGGGPACLRLRVVLSDEERAAVRGNVFWTPVLHEILEDWVRRHYRASLSPADLADVRLFQESEAALDELAGILELPI